MLQDVCFLVNHGGHVKQQVVGGPVEFSQLKPFHLVEDFGPFLNLVLVAPMAPLRTLGILFQTNLSCLR